MSKAKLIAVSAVCAAISVICLLLLSIPALKWIMLILAVFASVACCVPIMIDKNGLLYSLLTFAVTSIVGVFVGLANIVFIAPVVAFCIPVAIVKIYGETKQITFQVNEVETLEDPFGGEDKTVAKVQVEGKARLPRVVRWILYYVLLEVALGLTMLATWLLTPDMFATLLNNNVYIWLIVAAQFIVPPYNLLLNGCVLLTAKILRKALKPQ